MWRNYCPANKRRRTDSPFWRCHAIKRNRGVTLVEVVAGMIILASLASGVLISFTSHQKQIRQAQLQLEAADVAEQLLAGWYQASPQLPTNQTGNIGTGEKQWYWTTRTIDVTTVADTQLQKIQLAIYDQRATENNSPPLILMELIAPFQEGSFR